MPVIQDKQDFLRQLDRAIEETRRCLADRTARRPGAGTEQQLDALHRYLTTIKGHVTSGKVPSPPLRHAQSMGWILIDGWDPEDPLGALILDVNDYYLNRI